MSLKCIRINISEIIAINLFVNIIVKTRDNEGFTIPVTIIHLSPTTSAHLGIVHCRGERNEQRIYTAKFELFTDYQYRRRFGDC